jgi:hypothetical protein
MKLQSNTAKNQAKTIDLEIKRLDAAQARELLSIVQVRAGSLVPQFPADLDEIRYSRIFRKHISRTTTMLLAATCSSSGSHTNWISSTRQLGNRMDSLIPYMQGYLTVVWLAFAR